MPGSSTSRPFLKPSLVSHKIQCATLDMVFKPMSPTKRTSTIHRIASASILLMLAFAPSVRAIDPTIDFLLIGGGAAGGTTTLGTLQGAGGGGAGGLIYETGYAITEDPYDIVIGQGGAGTSGGGKGNGGGASTFDGNTASGGGGGASNDEAA